MRVYHSGQRGHVPAEFGVDCGAYGFPEVRGPCKGVHIPSVRQIPCRRRQAHQGTQTAVRLLQHDKRRCVSEGKPPRPAVQGYSGEVRTGDLRRLVGLWRGTGTSFGPRPCSGTGTRKNLSLKRKWRSKRGKDSKEHNINNL